jgi:hypothetical protein
MPFNESEFDAIRKRLARLKMAFGGPLTTAVVSIADDRSFCREFASISRTPLINQQKVTVATTTIDVPELREEDATTVQEQTVADDHRHALDLNKVSVGGMLAIFALSGIYAAFAGIVGNLCPFGNLCSVCWDCWQSLPFR